MKVLHAPVEGCCALSLEDHEPQSPVELEPSDWMDNAACAGRTSLFFGPAGERPEASELREWKCSRVCAVCPVQIECGQYAVYVRWSAPYPGWIEGYWASTAFHQDSRHRRRVLARAS